MHRHAFCTCYAYGYVVHLFTAASSNNLRVAAKHDCWNAVTIDNMANELSIIETSSSKVNILMHAWSISYGV